MKEAPDRLTSALAARYLMGRELGQGGMATVYLAEDLKHRRRVAVKVLKPELAAVLGADRFVQEITTTAALQHPHILPLFDSGEADGFLFYVMPFIDGETLRAKLDRETQLGVEEAVRIASDVADALHYAHSCGVIHRDIKPENILLANGRPMVADFGIALAVSAAAGGRMTETGLSLGTPHYMSPEQATAEKEIGPRSDIYSLASVLYEMLAGNPPHLGASAQQIIMKIITEQPADVTSLRKSVPANVAAALGKALEKLPADRFASAAGFAAALSDRGFTTATAGAAAKSAAAPSWRRRAAVLVPWVAFAAVSVAALAMPRGASGPVTRERVALWPYPITVGGLAIGLAISPDGRTFVSSDSTGGTRQLWLKQRDELNAVPIPGTAGGQAPAFSPDGEWIAFVADGKLKKVPRAGGPAAVLAEPANMFPPAVAWLDDDRITFNDDVYSLIVVRADGAGKQVAYDAAVTRRGVVSVSALPGGRGVFISTCTLSCVDQDLRVLDLRADSAHVLDAEARRAWYAPGMGAVIVRADGSVWVGDFDLRRLVFRSPPVPAFDGVRTGLSSADMALGPNGTLVYATGGAGNDAIEPVWVSRAGLATPVDSGWVVENVGGTTDVALSPDGRRIALSYAARQGRDVWIKQLPAGPFSRLTFEGGTRRPAWQRDGRSVVYLRIGDNGGTLFSRMADGTGGEELIASLDHSILAVEPTADSTRFVVMARHGGLRDLLLLERGSGFTPLLASERFEEMGPALSTDGRWLAYTSDETGRAEVYVRPYPAVEGGRWQVSRNGGAEARWAHSGRELFYRDAAGMLVAVEVLAGEAFVTGAQRALFATHGYWWDAAHHGYDVVPGDSSFLMVRRIGTASENGVSTVVVVDNWFTELRARARSTR